MEIKFMTTKAIKITSKGQATIPKEIRDLLKTDVVEFDVIEGAVVVRPVLSVGGSLRRYSREYIPLKDIKGKVWEEALSERADKKTA